MSQSWGAEGCSGSELSVVMSQGLAVRDELLSTPFPALQLEQNAGECFTVLGVVGEERFASKIPKQVPPRYHTFGLQR